MGTHGYYTDGVESVVGAQSRRDLRLGFFAHNLVTDTIVNGALSYVEQYKAELDPASWILSHTSGDRVVRVPVAVVAMEIFTHEFPDQLTTDNVVNIIEAVRQFNQVVTGANNG